MSLDDEVVIETDSTWKGISGPIVSDSIYNGETYDARLEQPGWTLADYDDSEWGSVAVTTTIVEELASQEIPPIRFSTQAN